MNKLELNEKVVEKLAQEDFKVTKKDIKVITDALLDTISDALVSGENVKLVNFGTFEVVDRSERVGRNPHSGEQIVIPAYRAPKFKAAPLLRTAVKEA